MLTVTVLIFYSLTGQRVRAPPAKVAVQDLEDRPYKTGLKGRS